MRGYGRGHGCGQGIGIRICIGDIGIDMSMGIGD